VKVFFVADLSGLVLGQVLDSFLGVHTACRIEAGFKVRRAALYATPSRTQPACRRHLARHCRLSSMRTSARLVTLPREDARLLTCVLPS